MKTRTPAQIEAYRAGLKDNLERLKEKLASAGDDAVKRQRLEVHIAGVERELGSLPPEESGKPKAK